MIDGLNDNVEAYGRVFHVQTEVTAGDRPVIRSRVFLDGAVVGCRESPLVSGDTSEDGVKERMLSQHEWIMDNLVRHAAELEVAAGATPLPEVARRATLERRRWTSTEVSRPDPVGDPRLIASLRVRQLVGPFSLALRPSPYHDPESVRARLESAARMIDGIMMAPHFSDIRVDEQVRFFDLRERVAAWRGGGRDAEEGSRIVLAMVAFAAHLRRISDRRELQAFDHGLLTWALGAVSRDDVSVETLGHLQALAGRDVELDGLLVQPDPVEKNRLLEVLLGLLDRTLPSQVRPGG